MFGDENRRTDWFKHGQSMPVPIDVMQRVQQRLIGELMGSEVWGVDGEAVRNEIGDDEFEGGGNHARYLYIPAGQIWIEWCLPMHAWPPLILHEYVEQYAMTMLGLNYEQAHNRARICERNFRAADRERFRCASTQDVLALAARELPNCLG
jgi:hypothetical protein